MYTLEEITIETFGNSEFDHLFSCSLPYMDEGTFSWNFYNNPTTDAEKKEALRDRFQKDLEMANEYPEICRIKCVLYKKDGVAIHLSLGAINSRDDNYVTWGISLFGPDGNGSKSWLYDLEYLKAVRDHFVNTYGVKGYKINAMNTGSLREYHLNKPGVGDLYNVAIDKVYTTDTGVELVTIFYTYK
jgi:hypothetical protein